LETWHSQICVIWFEKLGEYYGCIS
jgi:hypothetical protein